eukprot:s3514_g8.t1
MSCAKCRQATPIENDTWCLGCTGFQALQTELNSSWKYPGFRAAAELDLTLKARTPVHLRRRPRHQSVAEVVCQLLLDHLSNHRRRAVKVNQVRTKQLRNPPLWVHQPRQIQADVPLNQIIHPEVIIRIIHVNIDIIIMKEDTVGLVRGLLRGIQRRQELVEQVLAISALIACWTTLTHDCTGGHQLSSGHKSVPLLALGHARIESDMFKEGTEYHIADKERWDCMVINRGEVLEVHIPSTDAECSADLWAGFWVRQAFMLGTGDFGIIAKSIGCSDPNWSKYFSNMFNRKLGRIHFCASKPCASVEEFALHVTRVRIFSVEGFERAYMTSYIKKQITKWEKDPTEDLDEEAVDLTGAERPEEDEEEETDPPGDEEEVKKDEKSRGREERRALLTPAPKVKPKEGGDAKKEPGKSKLNDLEKQRLRERLAEARSKMIGATPGGGAGLGAELDPHEEEHVEDGSLREYSPSPVDDRALKDVRPPALRDQDKKIDPKTLKKEKKAKKEKARKEKEEARPRSSSSGAHNLRKKAKSVREGTKDGTMTSLQTQLVLKAQETAKEKKCKEEEERRRQKRKNPGRQLVKILTQSGGGKRGGGDGDDPPEGSSKRRKKKDAQRSKRKSRQGGDGDPSSSPDSETETSDDASDDGWDQNSSSSGDRKVQGGSGDFELHQHYKRRETRKLFRHCGATSTRELIGAGSGTAPSGAVNGPAAAGRSGCARGHLSSKIHGDTSSCFGRIVEHSQALRTPTSPGGKGRRSRDHPQRQEVRQDCRQALPWRKLVMGPTFKRSRRTRKRCALGRTEPRPKRQRQEGQQRQGRRKALVESGERGGWKHQGESAGEVDEACMNLEAPANAAAAFVSAEFATADGSGGFVKNALGLCDSFKRTGVVLAWLMLTLPSMNLLDGITQEFVGPWLKEIAEHKSASKRGRGANFPVRSGDLRQLEEVFKSSALTMLVVDADLNKWALRHGPGCLFGR